MKYFVDAPVAGFLTDEIHEIPDHAVEISDEQWQELLDKQAQGHTIIIANGHATTEDRRSNQEQPKALPPTRAFFDFLSEKEAETLGETALTNGKLFIWLTSLNTKKALDFQGDVFNKMLDLMLKEKVFSKVRKTELLNYLEAL